MAFTLTDYKVHNIRTEYRDDGLYYKAQIDCHLAEEAATLLPPGNVAFWAPTTAYILSYTRSPWNQDGTFEILAKDIDRCTEHVTPKGTEFKRSFYVLDTALQAFLAANFIGLDAYQGGSGWALRPAYMLDFSNKRLGPNWLVTLMAVDLNYHTGLRSRMTMID